MKIKVNGFEVCISAKSTFIPDATFNDDTAASVINQVVCILNVLSDMCKKEGSELNQRYGEVIQEWSNELFDQLDERGYYDEYRTHKNNA